MKAFPFGKLRVTSRDGVVEIPLTGNPKNDALLERLVRNAATNVTREDADPETAERAALEAGA